VFLICVSLIIDVLSIFFMYLLAISMSSIEKCLLESVAYFFIALKSFTFELFGVPYIFLL
jgi:hypothetical protein